MNRLVACCLLLAGCRPSLEPARPPRPTDHVRLTILATNDLHGQLEPLLRYTDEPAPRAYRVGGAEALAATVEELRARDPEGTLLVDAGDFMQGSMISNSHRGTPVRELFALLRYDAVAIGNHEFDFGLAGVPDSVFPQRRLRREDPNPPPARGRDLRGALKAWLARAPFPALAANIVEGEARPPRWPGLRAAAIVERRGVRIGIVGVTTPRTTTTTLPALVAGLRFEPLGPTVAREARALRAAGAAVVLLLAHVDAECADPPPAGCKGELFDEILARLEPGLVDAVVAGHSHQLLALRYRGVPVVESCSRGLFVGRLELTVDRARRRVLGEASRVLPPARVCHDLFVAQGGCDGARARGGELVVNPLLARHGALVARARALVDRHRPGARATRLLARSPRPFRRSRLGSETGSLFARALLAATDADFALFNAGSVRADLPAGEITAGHVFQAFPFDNRVATLQLSGHRLRALLELLLAHSYGVPSLAGLRARLRCGSPPARYRIVGLELASGEAVEDERDYTLALSDFLLTGGDGLGPVVDRVEAARKRVQSRLVRDVIIEHLARHGVDGFGRPGGVAVEGAPCSHWRGGARSPCD